MSGRGLDKLWYGQAGLADRAAGLPLVPLSWALRLGLSARTRLVKPVRVDRPVVSVGNLTVGGSGKTPLVIHLIGALEAQGAKVAMVSRGYGRKSRGCRVVRAPGSAPPAWEVSGDEALLIALRCPAAAVVVGEDRLEAARLAIASCRPDVIVLDDAFQHLRLARDRDVLAIHASRGFGNRRLFPRGPLREPMTALGRANLAVFTHSAGEDLATLRARHGLGDELPAAAVRFEAAGLTQGPLLRPLDGEPPRRVLAACGIAHPGGFRSSLEAAGFEVLELVARADHGALPARALSRLARRAGELGAEALLVTEKDLVKLGQVDLDLPVFALRLEARVEAGGTQLDEMVSHLLDKPGEEHEPIA